MSNVLAIATVTEALRQTLEKALKSDLAGASHAAAATALRPGTTKSSLPDVGVNIFLYQVLPNAAHRNTDLPTRREEGSVVRRPQAALNLQYILSCYGEEIDLEPQRVLASITRSLHAGPVLTRAMIRKIIQDIVTNKPGHYLKDSDLAEQVELVRFMPLSLNLEELSKLWSVFFQTPYVLSVAYLASVVLIDGDGMPQPSLPVSGRNLYGTPFRQPFIEQVMPIGGSDFPLLADSTVVIRGQRLSGPATSVRLNGVEAAPQGVSDTRITFDLSTLPAGSLRAGVLGVQVIQHMPMGTPPVLHRGVESNVAAAVLHPVISPSITLHNVKKDSKNRYIADMELKVNPVVGKTQRITLLLNEITENDPEAFSFVSKPRSADSGTITIPVSGLKAADYFVRIQVDGSESVLDPDPASGAFGPKVKIQ